ncbi:hypothetical protein [Bowdeniella massiliensis]|uniref:hypothetical protein n=1 Tax=Bowdeniella massiliensis TaxID=2932264 RepID=UPI00202818D6|nr:hypothetical protein [Bowdeniella massiliensis]
MAKGLHAIGLSLGLSAVLLSGCAETNPKVRDHYLTGMTLRDAAAVIPNDASRVYQFVPLTEGAEAESDLSDDASPDWTIIAACSSDAYVEDSDWLELAVVPNRLLDEQARRDVLNGYYRNAVSCGWIREGMEAGPPDIPKR